MDDLHNTIFDEMIVFALKDRETADNFAIFAKTHGIEFKGVKGHWRGEDRPYTIVTPAFGFVTLYFHNWFVGQEAVLHLAGKTTRNGGRKAELIYMDDVAHHVPYGEWTAVHKDAALAKPGWTYDPRQDQYYTCLDIPEGNEATARNKEGAPA